MASDTKDNDLPLVSNIKDILINHYIFDFSCSFSRRCFACKAVLFLTPVTNENNFINCNCIKNMDSHKGNFDEENSSNIFVLILDCQNILVDSIEEIILSESENMKYKRYRPEWFTAGDKLHFSTDKWSLKIWKSANSCKFCFPHVIRISYRTSPDGSSLLWVSDQDKKLMWNENGRFLAVQHGLQYMFLDRKTF